MSKISQPVVENSCEKEVTGRNFAGRKKIHRQFKDVINERRVPYLEQFDHGDGPERVDDQNFRHSKVQRDMLTLMKRWVQRTYTRQVCVLVCQFDNIDKRP